MVMTVKSRARKKGREGSSLAKGLQPLLKNFIPNFKNNRNKYYKYIYSSLMLKKPWKK